QKRSRSSLGLLDKAPRPTAARIHVAALHQAADKPARTRPAGNGAGASTALPGFVAALLLPARPRAPWESSSGPPGPRRASCLLARIVLHRDRASPRTGTQSAVFVAPKNA